MQSTIYTKFIGLELYAHMYSNVHIQTHSSKKQISYFFLTVYQRRYSRNSIIEQKRFILF